MRLRIRTCFPMPGLTIGESIAVNGVCLTVEQGQEHADYAVFSAYASAESLRKTNLGQLISGSNVNLERALALGDRLGGHIVSGHIDAVATIRSIAAEGESRRITLEFPAELAAEVVTKGSVTLDGISLTINDCDEFSLTVNIIPETWHVTTASGWKQGSSVNMETDILGKYVRRCLSLSGTAKTPQKSDISLELLRANGFA